MSMEKVAQIAPLSIRKLEKDSTETYSATSRAQLPSIDFGIATSLYGFVIGNDIEGCREVLAKPYSMLADFDRSLLIEAAFRKAIEASHKFERSLEWDLVDLLLEAGDNRFRADFLQSRIARGHPNDHDLCNRILQLSPRLVLHDRSLNYFPFHVACRSKAVETLVCLTELCGLLPGHLAIALSANDAHGETPLGTAARRQDIDATRILLDAHYQINLQPSPDILNYIIRSKNSEIFQLIFEAFPTSLAYEGVEGIIRHGSLEQWNTVLSRRPDLLRRSDALHLAVKACKADIVSEIVRLHAGWVLERDIHGLFPIDWNKPSSNDRKLSDSQESIRKTLLSEVLRRCTPSETKRMFYAASSEDSPDIKITDLANLERST